MHVTRRGFLAAGAAAGGAAALGGLFSYLRRQSLPSVSANPALLGRGGYGPIAPVRASNRDATLLALPEGFQYTVFDGPGAVMSDGIVRPGLADGMAAFATGREWRLVRNHELNNGHGTEGRSLAPADRSYDGFAAGGTTTIVVDPATRLPVRDFVSLSGTLQNCAGGATPWGSWISCEETVLGTTVNADGSGGFTEEHGYCFEVPAAADGPVRAVPLKAMGRFVHEAVTVDRRTGIVYETEDRLSAGFYRFLPDRKRDLAAGGVLQMLAIRDAPGYDTRRGQTTGTSLECSWVDIPDPDPADPGLDGLAVYRQGIERGAATFARLEGCLAVGKEVYFVSTNGGDAGCGQIWRHTHTRAGGRLDLVFESAGAEVLDMPDNLTVSPRGGVLVCEDGPVDNYLRGITKRGEIFDFARNIVPDNEGRELAGACWAPDGRTLFVNVWFPGLTFAIWGPWKAGAL